MRRYKKIFMIVVYIFALIGLFFVFGYIAIRLHLTNVSGTNDRMLTTATQSATSTEAWAQTEEWQTLKNAITADAPTINKVATASGIPARLIVAQLVVEQLRLFTSNREIYKEVFAPLNILGVQSQYSWGIMGIKQDTAIELEKNLADTASPFYLGPDAEKLITFATSDHDSERFNRLTDQHDHYWSYLYGALYIKEIEQQWKTAGFDISHNIGVLSTLYNIGFNHSKPNGTPAVGGAVITINNVDYSFGSLAESFYNSNELNALFPRN